ncbi:MAG: PD-(D/E)XK nuclease family protein, partial [Candidatus Altiarchaeota archaeon]|nr:PD-(D/E)XK nuclease family protein [Candidatus Altiarchaeota archaeon]
FRGAVDSLLRDRENGKIIVLDFKTRGYPLKEDTHTYYQNQMDIYNLLLRKTGHETENYSLLAFYHPLSIHEKGEVKFKADIIKLKVDIASAEAIFKKAIEVLKNDMPEPSKKCGFCNWVRVKS